MLFVSLEELCIWFSCNKKGYVQNMPNFKIQGTVHSETCDVKRSKFF